MSIRVSTRVWEHSRQKGSRLLAILAIADHADDDGVAFPGIPCVARKARVDGRQAQRIVHQIAAAGELYIREGRGRANTNLYFVVIGLDAQIIHNTLVARFEMTPLEAAVATKDLLQKQERAGKKGGVDVTFSPEKGGTQTTFSTPPPAEKGGRDTTFSGKKGDIFDGKGDIAMSPESCNHDDEVVDFPESDFQSLLEDLAGFLLEIGMAAAETREKAAHWLADPDIGPEVCRRQLDVAETRFELARASKRGLKNPVGYFCLSVEENWPPPPDEPSKKCWFTDEEASEHFNLDLPPAPAVEEAPLPANDHDPRLDRVWQAALGELQLQMTKATFETWVKQTHVAGYDDGKLAIGAQNKYAVDWLDNRLKGTILRVVSGLAEMVPDLPIDGVQFQVIQCASNS